MNTTYHKASTLAKHAGVPVYTLADGGVTDDPTTEEASPVAVTTPDGVTTELDHLPGLPPWDSLMWADGTPINA